MKSTSTKTKFFLFSALALCLVTGLLVVGGGNSNPVDQANTDRLFAEDAEEGTKIPLTFLYAVDRQTGKIFTYSPVIGEIQGTGNLVQAETTVAANQTITGKDTPCNLVQAGTGDLEGDNMPFLTWTDMQDNNQHQFFTKGELVIITEQPLMHDVNNFLLTVPSSTK